MALSENCIDAGWYLFICKFHFFDKCDEIFAQVALICVFQNLDFLWNYIAQTLSTTTINLNIGTGIYEANCLDPNQTAFISMLQESCCDPTPTRQYLIKFHTNNQHIYDNHCNFVRCPSFLGKPIVADKLCKHFNASLY